MVPGDGVDRGGAGRKGVAKVIPRPNRGCGESGARKRGVNPAKVFHALGLRGGILRIERDRAGNFGGKVWETTKFARKCEFDTFPFLVPT